MKWTLGTPDWIIEWWNKGKINFTDVQIEGHGTEEERNRKA